MDERRAKLVTPVARTELWNNGRKIFYWRVRRNRRLGYLRRGGRGSWFALIVLWSGKVKQHRVGTADDLEPADGETVLNFYQALAKAEEWYDENADIAAPDRRQYEYDNLFPEVRDGPVYTVGNAAKAYAEWYRVHRKGFDRTYAVLKNHVVEPLGHLAVADLDTPTLQAWLDGHIDIPPIRKAGRLIGTQLEERRADEEYRRKRKNTANTHLSILRAVLNRAYDNGKVDSDRAWAKVRPFKRSRPAARIGFLEKDQIQALLASCPPDLALLVTGALMTGCRAGDLFRMRVEDFMREQRRVVVLEMKTDKFHHISLSREGGDFFERQTQGRGGDEPMFVMSDGMPWSYHQHREPFIRAQEAAGIDPPITFHGLRHTYASHATMAGLPLKAVANQLGHSTTRMVDQFYAHLSQSYVDDEIRDKMPSLLG